MEQLFMSEISKILLDRSKTGKKRPWKKHKFANNDVIEALKILEAPGKNRKIGKVTLHALDPGGMKSKKIADCGNVLEFGRCPKGHGLKLKKAYFCKERVCCLCTWRKSLFVYSQFLIVTHKLLEVYPKTAFLFITLTCRNCELDELGDTITHLNKSISKLLNYRRIKSAFKGTFRSLEVTFNPETATFHPHVHAVVAVNWSYFKTHFISFEDFQEFWKKALKVDYYPDCWIVRVKPKKKGISTVNEEIEFMDKTLIEKALVNTAGEVAKYSVKVGDIVNPLIKPDDSRSMVRAKIALRESPKRKAEILGYLIKGISNRRLICYTGRFKEAYQALKCEDVEKSDLIHVPGESVECTCPVCQSELVQLHYIWNGENYIEREVVKERGKRGRKA
jgi:plasmid rolling circle replication initiator protein Rep